MTIENFSSVPVSQSERGVFSPPSDYNKIKNLNNTDTVFQDVKVFIEGVEVPFSSVSVNQAMWSMPTCTVEVPPHPGLLEICKYYHPKIHVFYKDLETNSERVLFWGHIVASSFSKNVQGMGSSSISFRCVHKNQVLKQLLLYYGNVTTNEVKTANSPPGTLVMNTFCSELSIVSALKGLTGIAVGKDMLVSTNTDISTADTSKLDASLSEFERRLTGMPSVVVNLWNQIKQSALSNIKSNLTTLTLYMPLFEVGIAYFERMSGHYLLEKQQADSKAQYCPQKGSATEIMVGPLFRTGFMDAFQTQLTVQSVSNAVGFSGQLTSFIDVCEKFLQALSYELVTLASPAEVPIDPESYPGGEYDLQSKYVAIDTVIKPNIPFYYSPVCNVLFPRMVSSVEIQQDDMAVPTRNFYYHNALPDNQSTSQMTTNFYGPNSVREAISIGRSLDSGKSSEMFDLKVTTGTDPNVPGRYEQGKGVVPRRVNPPWWLTQMIKDQATQGNSSTFPAKDTASYNNLILLARAWEDRVGYDLKYDTGAGNDAAAFTKSRNREKDKLNPFGVGNDLQPYQRLMFAAVDYEFANLVSQSRTGSVTGLFNPYLVVGYPMDVLDDTPGNPSFHALCTSVNHTITARGMWTTVGMACVTTYAELTNYYNPPLAPWLQIALGVVNADALTLEDLKNRGVISGDFDFVGVPQYGDTDLLGTVRSTIIQNPDARQKANLFYHSVFGVGAADPSEMMDFGTGQIIPQGRDGMKGNLYANARGNTSIPTPNGGEGNDWMSSMGNLRLVKRPIETRMAIEAKMSTTDMPYQFIDMIPENYSSSVVEYSNPYLDESFLLEPGASLFLDYDETLDFIQPAKTLIENQKKNKT